MNYRLIESQLQTVANEDSAYNDPFSGTPATSHSSPVRRCSPHLLQLAVCGFHIAHQSTPEVSFSATGNAHGGIKRGHSGGEEKTNTETSRDADKTGRDRDGGLKKERERKRERGCGWEEWSGRGELGVRMDGRDAGCNCRGFCWNSGRGREREHR